MYDSQAQAKFSNSRAKLNNYILISGTCHSSDFLFWSARTQTEENVNVCSHIVPMSNKTLTLALRNSCVGKSKGQNGGGDQIKMKTANWQKVEMSPDMPKTFLLS